MGRLNLLFEWSSISKELCSSLPILPMEYLSNDLAVSRDHMILGDLGLSQPNSDYDVNAMDVCLSEGNTSNQNKTIVIGLSVVVFL